MLSFSTLDSLNKNYSALRAARLTDINTDIKNITEKFAENKIDDCVVTWRDIVETIAPDDITAQERSEQQVFVSVFWDSSKQKVMLMFQDSMKEALAGLSAEIRIESAPYLAVLVKEAEKQLKAKTEALRESKDRSLKVTMLSVLDGHRMMKDLGTMGTLGTDEDEDTTWNEREDGGPSEGDIMMTNGVAE